MCKTGFSILIAAPIAYFIVDYWLADFAYKTPIDIWVFVVAAASPLVLALSTISYQSLRAAFQNPINALREE